MTEAGEIRLGPRPDGSTVVLGETLVAGLARGKTVGLLERWLARGTITPTEYAAAVRFSEDYHLAQLGPHYASSTTERRDKSHGDQDNMRQVYAYRRMRRVERALGCHAPALVYVIGYQDSIHAFARRMGVTWKRAARRVRQALSALASYYA